VLRPGEAPRSPTVRHRRWAALLTALVLALSSPLWLHGARAAAATPGPCAVDWICIGASTPPSAGSTAGGGGGGGGGAGGKQVCVYQSVVVPCSNQYGELDPNDGCYYMLVQPQPPAGDPLWGGKAPGAGGAVYLRTCSNQAAGDSVEIYLPTAPAVPAVVTPAEVADEARAKIHLAHPVVHTAPAATASPALVGAPIWLWIDTARRADGAYPWATKDGLPKAEATATDSGLTVEAQVWATGITWDMGDGGVAQCAGSPGTAYAPADGAKPSPDCGYTYTQPSSKAPGSYAITATVTWHVHWETTTPGVVAAGDYDIDPVPGIATDLRVDELQVLNQPTKNS
jgi:hypothetical protein